MSKLPTRLRRTNGIRNLARENSLHMSQIICPVFIVEGENIRKEIFSMKNQYHFSIDMLLKEIPILQSKGIATLLIFASTEDKSIDGSSGIGQNKLVQKGIKKIKKQYPKITLIADVCLCQYKKDGHCCIYKEDGNIDRKLTLKALGDIALSYAKAGVDMVAPSDMMDGRVGKIRQLLDKEDFEHVGIMAYSAKYASAFYGPFRIAAQSAPSFGDRKAYQMNPANRKEAIREIKLDIDEGADIVMVKPAMPYLDIIADAKNLVTVPVAAYQVSGEYAMICSAVDQGIIDEKAIYESLLSIKRSGADIIITYFAKEIQEIIMREEGL